MSPTTAAWSALAILSGLNLLNYLDRSVMSAVLPPLQKDLSMSDGDAGWAASAFMIGYFVTAPFFGYLGDRLVRKYLMLIGVIVWSAATAASGIAHSFAELFAIRMAVGVGEACFVTMGPSWISDCFAGARRNTALAIFYVAIPVGSAIGYVVGGAFASHGDWRGAFIYAGLPGVLLALSLLALREPKRGESDGVHADSVPMPRVGEIAALLVNCRYNLLVWGYAAQTFAVGGFQNWGPSFLSRVHNMSLSHADAIFGPMVAGAGLTATLLGGFIGTALRRRSHAGYALLLAASLVLAAPVCFGAVMTSNTTLSLVTLGAGVFLVLLPTSSITAEMFEIVPVHLRASSMAVSVFIIHLFGDLSSPGIVGSLSTTWNSLQKAVLVLPFSLVVGAVLWCILVGFARQPHEVEA